MIDEKKALRSWGECILEKYPELGQKVYEEEKYKQLAQYCEEGFVTGVFDINAGRDVIEPWLSEIAESINKRWRIQMQIDNLLLKNMKKL